MPNHVLTHEKIHRRANRTLKMHCQTGQQVTFDMKQSLNFLILYRNFNNKYRFVAL